MPTQNIDATLSAADIQAIKDALAAVLEKLPFLVNLTAEERKSIARTGPEGLSFVKNALAAAQANPEILPANFDTAAFKKDIDLFEIIIPLNILVASLASQLDDTQVALGGEAMRQGTLVYTYVKAAAKTTPGLKPVAEQLGERFKKSGKRKTTPKPTS